MKTKLGLVALLTAVGLWAQDVDPQPAPRVTTTTTSAIDDTEVEFVGKAVRDGNTWTLVSLVVTSKGEERVVRDGVQLGNVTTTVVRTGDVLEHLRKNVGKRNAQNQVLLPGIGTNSVTGKLTFQEQSAPTSFLRAVKAVTPQSPETP